MTTETKVRVRYAETDQMGVVYHANYLVWFEVGRVEHLRQLGLDYKSMEQQEGCHIAVVEAVARYKSPARYDDHLTIRTSVAHVRRSIISFDYVILRPAQDEEPELILCEGSTTHVVVDRNMKVAPMPPRFAAALNKRETSLPHEVVAARD